MRRAFSRHVGDTMNATTPLGSLFVISAARLVTGKRRKGKQTLSGPYARRDSYHPQPLM